MHRLVVSLSLSLLACGGTQPEPAPAPTTTAPTSTIVSTPPSTGPGPQVPSGNAPPPFDALLAALPNATAIHMHSGWMGLSPIAPIDHRYELTLVGNQLTTHLVCGAAGQTSTLPDGSIPLASVLPILQHLATAPVTPGPYEARITHTDDYPDDTLVIDTPAGSLTFHTSSQGELGDPWEITAAGSSAVVDSPIPGEAYRDLARLLDAERCSTWVQTVHR